MVVPNSIGTRWLGGAIGTSGMPLTASGRERPPDSDACKQLTQKLGVIEASYASAIIGVVDRPLFRREGTTQP